MFPLMCLCEIATRLVPILPIAIFRENKRSDVIQSNPLEMNESDLIVKNKIKTPIKPSKLQDVKPTIVFAVIRIQTDNN